jgi:hypothetical protein
MAEDLMVDGQRVPPKQTEETEYQIRVGPNRGACFDALATLACSA